MDWFPIVLIAGLLVAAVLLALFGKEHRPDEEKKD